MIYLLIAAATLITSLISGVLSMAGGMILMVVFGFFLSVPVAMVLHGVAQAFSNGSRVWIYRRHIRWRVLGFYAIGALAMTAVFAVFTFVPSIGLVFMLIGTFPFLALAIPKSIHLDMEKGPVAVLSGVLVTVAQLLAGASGPVLDIFYVQSEMTKEQILGTKAVTQTLGHVLKLIYYGSVMAVASTQLPLWVVPAVVAAAILGNYLGSLIVARMTDNQFKQIGRYVVMVIGVICIGKGILEMTA
ncbi:MAG: sulfite exporter TauE/SafE family protein [Pseudomonadales bacterium]|nr:sulfite exporter TauE/SafE family protein [Pseudomonadales bacterium]MBO6566071.1 sulfite exporter TauE/SafE family protein [Pseudomonadales bacterium]MBO6596456.1 sulfite exporter TauE/SafE family protein [Pseudomonadales bacterium]MBO6657662.1 sulfite exporter TauE/SafE family protein [Pseudomonadales bacterium]MBO6822936.1 sulfite exporter TauE/SafE family protein [Pseudomonadales bacterium]